MYTYVQWRGCKKENTATYVHTGRVSNAYSRIRTARARVHGWVGTEKLRRRRVHGEPTGLDGTADGNEAWRTAEWRKRPCVRPAAVETGSCSSGGVWRTAKRRKRTSYGRNGVLLIGRGVAYCKTEETDLCWIATVETGVLFIERGVAYRKTRLHEILFISTVDLLQPPRAPVHPASTVRYSIGYCSTTPLHGLLFNHPSTGYCSSTPPPSTVHPALHGVVLFIQPSTGSYSSSPNRLDQSGSCSSRGNTMGSCSSTPTRNCSSKPPNNAHCSSRGSIDRLQLAAVAKESLDRVQLTAIDRSLGFNNA